jgi:alcohol dehydrogenase class IV
MNDIFNPPYENEPLPVIAVPTTAGTGSEANPYSILTLDGKDLKKTFNYSKSYPKVSFADPKYTESLPYNITVSTAIDAFCHCIESYLSVKSTPFSAIYAECGMKHIFKHLEAFADSPESSAEIEYETREDLMLGALCGGVAINTTGTCFPHPMGYNLTLINGLPHGKACGVFTGEFLRIHEKAAENDYKLRSILNSLYSACGSSFEKICAVIETLTDYHEKFDNDTLLSYVEKIKDAKNFSNSYVKIPEKKILKIYQNCIGEKT